MGRCVGKGKKKGEDKAERHREKLSYCLTSSFLPASPIGQIPQNPLSRELGIVVCRRAAEGVHVDPPAGKGNNQTKI